MNKKFAFFMLAGVAVLSSCSKQGWSVKGTIDNAPDGAKVSIEGFNAGIWYNIDSVEVAKDGRFSFVSEAGAPFPDIYRISLDGKCIYFPIDSLENITIAANADNFDVDYTVAGWDIAEQMMSLDKRIADAVATQGATAALNDSTLKRELTSVVIDDESGLLGYYIINKTIGDKPIFSPDNRADLRTIGSTANRFAQKYPDDPRTAYLAKIYLNGRAAINPDAAPTRFIEAKESGLFDIELYDAKGVKQNLADIAKNSGLTLLSFTSYQMDGSVPYNVTLNSAYEKYRQQGLSIYQVALGDDEVQWRASAVNLPWTAVWYDQKDGGALIRLYNVGVLPTTYVIDRNGDLVDRVDDPADLDATIRKHL